MPLVLARIDDRLIHGQVVVGWARALEADCLIVANDAVAADPMQRQLLPMAVPPQIKVGIYRVTEAVEALRGPRYEGRRIILLFASLADALLYVQGGGVIERLNLGGIRQAPGRQQLRTAVALSPADAAAARALMAGGSRLDIQMVPGDSPEALGPLLDSYFPKGA
jgi:mannose/fructose/N-acetylgalactosamine-specific phosphotransferase system component IIB